MKSPSIPRHVLWAVVLVLGAGVAGFVAFRMLRNAPERADLPVTETHRTNLVLQAGHWLLPGTTNTYTGLLFDTYDRFNPPSPPSGERAGVRGQTGIPTHALPPHPNPLPQGGEGIQDHGARKSLSMVSNGLLHGVSRGWHANGQQQVEEHFVAGTSRGLRTKWHPNGQKLSEVTIVDGKLQGTFRRWDAQGALTEEIEMKDGEPDGISRSYFPSGSPKSQVLVKNGKVMSRQSWQDGE